MNRPRGLSLVELLVAATLMLMAFAGALTLLARSQGAYRTSESQARLQETARAALDLLAADLRLAGHLGLAPPGTPVEGAQPVGTPEPAPLAVAGRCGESLALDLAVPLSVADGRYGSGATGALGCAPAPSGRAVGGADALLIRHAAGDAVASAAGRLQLESNRRRARLVADGSALFDPAHRISNLQVSLYYISADSTGAAGLPALRRKRLVGGTRPAFEDEELIAGVADLQVEYGLAPNAADAAAPARYVSPAALPSGVQVTSLRLWLLVQSDVPESQPSELPALDYANRSVPAERSRYRRLLATRSIALRNGMVQP
jgi:type IV pilus assembly protein PilW